MDAHRVSRTVRLGKAGVAVASAVLAVSLGFAPPAPGAPPGNIKATITTGYPVDFEHLHPHQDRSNAVKQATRLIFETLLDRDAEKMELRPLLAVSWRNVDSLTWEFKLRQGVKFTNGEPFNAESVKFSIEHAMATPGAFGGSLLRGIYDTTEMPDAYTVRIKTKVPDNIIPVRLAVEPMPMIPPRWGATADAKEKSQRPVGSGPYKLGEFVVGDRVVLERNEEYWGEKPPTKRLVWRLIPDPRTRVAALQRGEVDMIHNLVMELVPTVEKDSKLTVYSTPGSFTHKLIFNISQGGAKYLQDRRVRQALNHAVDHQALIKGLYSGRAVEYFSVLPMQANEYWAGQPYDYNPEKAKKLLAEAGYPNGFETEIVGPTARYPMGEQAVQAIADYFNKVGVRTKITLVEWSVHNARAREYKFDTMFYWPYSYVLWDPDMIFGFFLPEKKVMNYYVPPESFQGLIREQSQEFDPKKRREKIVMIQKLLWAEAPWLTLYHLPEIYGMSRKVKGFKMAPDQVARYEKAYVER